MEECNHSKTELVEDGIRRCLLCDEEFCLHPQIDHDSTCIICGEYITEVSIDKPWNDSNYSRTNQTSKNVSQYINHLESLGYSSDIVEKTIQKFTKVGCSAADEKFLLAACVWMAHLDIGFPRTMSEIAKSHKITKSGIKKGRTMALEFFPEYVTQYITVSDMIQKILKDLESKLKEEALFENDKNASECLTKNFNQYYEHVHELAKFVEDNWEKSNITKRSAPQNIASGCVFLYISESPTLKSIIDTPSKKNAVCKIMGPSSITINKICKLLKEEFINVS
jgi:hypothetical protein